MTGNKSIDEFVANFLLFAGGKLKAKEDVVKLIEFCFAGNMEEELKQFAFTSKYLNGLIRVSNKPVGNQITNIETIRGEISTNAEKAALQLSSLVSRAEFRDEFIEKYLSLSQTAVESFMGVISDFEWFKMYLNEIKSKSE
jgi:hypothetical protein